MALVLRCGIGGGVKTLIHRFPGVIGAVLALADAVALVCRAGGVVGGVAVDEVVVEVLFTGQIGAPGRHAHGAVVQCAEHLGAAWIAGGSHAQVTGQRAADGHGRHGTDAPMQARTGYPLPLTRGIPSNFQHTDAMGGLLLAHLVHRALAPAILQLGERQTIGMQGGVDVLVVDDQQTMLVGRILEGKEMHAVVVVAGLQQLGLPVLGGVLLPDRGIIQHRIAPAEEGPGAVTLGDQHLIEVRSGLCRHAGKAHQRGAAWSAWAALTTEQTTAKQTDSSQCQPALEYLTAAAVDDGVQIGRLTRVEAMVVYCSEVGVVMLVFLSHVLSVTGYDSERCC